MRHLMCSPDYTPHSSFWWGWELLAQQPEQQPEQLPEQLLVLLGLFYLHNIDLLQHCFSSPLYFASDKNKFPQEWPKEGKEELIPARD